MSITELARPDLSGTEQDPVLGKITPRIWTKPLILGPAGPCGCGCALSRETSEGFEVEDFARDVVGQPLDPWERWQVIHGLELLPNGWPRFRQLLILVARQNGKTHLLVILSLYWMFKKRVGIVLGTSTKLDYSRESWLKVVNLIRRTGALAPAIAARGAVRSVNGEQEVAVIHRDDNGAEVSTSRYKIAAANETGGRSLTVDRLVEDEIRQHHDYSAHEAADNAMNAVPDAQGWAITNEGDDRAIVLHEMYDAAELFILTGEGDYRLGLFAYSAPPGCDLEDVEATAQANPNLGRRIFWENLQGKAKRAKQAGGEAEARYRTEVLCQRVRRMKTGPIDEDAWLETAVDVRPTGSPRFFVTIARDAVTATVAVAAMQDGVPHVELAEHLPGTDWLADRLGELAREHPTAKFAAFQAGPVKFLVPGLGPLGVSLELLPAGDAASSCAHLEKLVKSRAFTHSPDAIVAESLKGAEKRDLDGAAWVWDWSKSAGDLSPLVAVTGALWLLEKHPAYDLLSSVF